MRAKVLLHEVAHGLAWRMGVDGPEVRQKYGGDARARGEAIAEGAAYIAAHHFGLDTSGYSFDYVAGWVRDAEKLLEWGGGEEGGAGADTADRRGRAGGRGGVKRKRGLGIRPLNIFWECWKRYVFAGYNTDRSNSGLGFNYRPAEAGCLTKREGVHGRWFD
ncbi:hypothetical protein SAMN00808754_1608 [Thermanaeromonas toyohensis ToBE]|uniref:Uncharacterized protein n=2 Tax=Thermanaeromonas TaxID=202949 RepID=A0A1W1VTL1_9FIRM|nr:hypothetical protein SAMN00808754_1608 [Thermanaeromonas toyohensis ToBE]